jgi:3-deoxy-D-manno-octulosonate 8-phosphate phosphatase (KDO 8-P phosphatase)
MKAGGRIRLFGMDVDGVLTDAGIYHGSGGLELKKFNVHDGMGVTLLLKAGIVPFIITARSSEAVAKRARELGIVEVHQGAERKGECLDDITARLGAGLGEVAFIGDDLSDMPVLTRVGFPIAVANAVGEVRDIARLITVRKGGDGAVREACEHVIRLNGYEGTFRALLEGQAGAGA